MRQSVKWLSDAGHFDGVAVCLLSVPAVSHLAFHYVPQLPFFFKIGLAKYSVISVRIKRKKTDNWMTYYFSKRNNCNTGGENTSEDSDWIKIRTLLLPCLLI